MSERPPDDGERVRSAELIAALSPAADLGTGVPLEHGIESTLIAMRLGDRLGVDAGTASGPSPCACCARLEEVPVRCVVDGIDQYLELAGDTAGPLGLALRALPGDARRTVAAQVGEAFAPFAAGAGYSVPGACLAGVAR